MTPFFYKVITIMSGWTGMPLATFIATFILARRLRFFIVAGFLWKFGEPIRDFIEKRLGLMFTLFVPLLVGGFVVVGPYDPQPLPFVGRLWFGCFNEHGRFDFRRDLGRITCPVLVMAGEEDPITPPEFSDAIVDHLRDE